MKTLLTITLAVHPLTDEAVILLAMMTAPFALTAACLWRMVK